MTFEQGMKRAAQTAETAAGRIKKAWAGHNFGFADALKGFAAAFTVGVLSNVIKNALEYAGSLGETAQQLGVTTKELQTFRFAAQQNGATLEEADKSLGKFSLSIRDRKSVV